MVDVFWWLRRGRMAAPIVKYFFSELEKKVVKKDDVMEVGGRVMKGEGKEKG